MQRESSGPNIPIGLPPFLNQCPTEISLSSFKLYCPAAMFKCIRTPFSSEKPYNCATFRTEEDKGNRPNRLLQFKISMCKGNVRPVPTKWETSHKNPFPRYDQVQNGILHVMVAALFEVQNYFHLVKFLCFLLISEMFNEPYLLQFPGDLSLILWQQWTISLTQYYASQLRWILNKISLRRYTHRKRTMCRRI